MQIEVDTDRRDRATTKTTCRCRSLIGTTRLGLVRARAIGRARSMSRAHEPTRSSSRVRHRRARRPRVSSVHGAAPLDIYSRTSRSPAIPACPRRGRYGPLLWRDENATRRRCSTTSSRSARAISRRAASGSIGRTRRASTRSIGIRRSSPIRTRCCRRCTTRACATRSGRRRTSRRREQARSRAGAERVRDAARATSRRHRRRASTSGASRSTSRIPPRTRGGRRTSSTYTDGIGVEGFKLDYAEDIVLGILGERVPWQFADGSDERTMHYGYTLLYHRDPSRGARRRGGFLLTRTGRWGDQKRGMIIWPGDLDADLRELGDPIAGETKRAVGGLPTALAFGIGLCRRRAFRSTRRIPAAIAARRRTTRRGCAGSRRTRCGPRCRSATRGARCRGNSRPRTGARGSRSTSIASTRGCTCGCSRTCGRTRSRCATTGRPIVRPVGLAYPELGEHPADEYLLGDSMLVGAGDHRRPDRARRCCCRRARGVVVGRRAAQRHAQRACRLDTLPLSSRARRHRADVARHDRDARARAGATIESFANNAGVLVVRVAPGHRVDSRSTTARGSRRAPPR